MAMTTISDKIDEMLLEQIEGLKTLKPGDPKFKDAEEAFAGLYKVRQEHYKTDLSDEEKMTELENARKEAENKQQIEEAKIELEKARMDIERDRNDLEEKKNELAEQKTKVEEEIEKEKIQIEKEKIRVADYKNDLESLIEHDKIKLERDKLEFEKLKLDAENDKAKRERRTKWTEIGTNVVTTVLHATVEAAAIVLPIMFYNTWIKQGLEFEKDGTFTSTTFKGVIGKFKPTRK